MVKKAKKSSEVEPREISAPLFYSNELQLGASYDEVVINFGLTVPKYSETAKIEDFPVARIILTWDTVEGLLELLQKAILYRKEAKKPKGKIEGKIVKRG